ncbi:MAG: hypothetical protein ACR2L0_09955 [Gaiellaceae bacterium]
MLAVDAWLLSARWEGTIAGTAAVGLGVLAVSLVLRFSPGVPVGLACLAGSYAAALESRGVDVDLSTTLYAALFFLTAELAYWSLELSPGVQPAPGAAQRRVLFLALGALAALTLAGLVLAAALEPLPRNLLVQGLGVAGALVALGVIAVLVRRSEPC